MLKFQTFFNRNLYYQKLNSDLRVVKRLINCTLQQSNLDYNNRFLNKYKSLNFGLGVGRYCAMFKCNSNVIALHAGFNVRMSACFLGLHSSNCPTKIAGPILAICHMYQCPTQTSRMSWCCLME